MRQCRKHIPLEPHRVVCSAAGACPVLVSRVVAGGEGSRQAAQGMQPPVAAAAAHVWDLLPDIARQQQQQHGIAGWSVSCKAPPSPD